jgi:hypothetical protein
MSQFPNQRKTRKEKIKEYGSIEDWAIAVFNSVKVISDIQSIGIGVNSRERQVLRNLYDGILDLEDFEYVLKPYGEVTPEYPSELRHYDRISNKVHLLVGEEIKRPFNFRAVAINSDAVSKFEDMVKQKIIESMMEEITAEMQAAGMVPEGTVDPSQIQPPEEIIRLSKTDLQSHGEIQANNALEYFKEFLDIQEVFNRGWEDLIVTGDDIYYTGVSSNDPLLRRVDAKYFDYDRTHTVNYIEDAQWAYEERWMPVSQIYDEYFEFLDEEDVNDLEKMKGTYKQNIGYGSGIPVVYMRDTDHFNGHNQNDYTQLGSNSVIKVTNFVWKSLRKIGFVIYEDPETGEVLEKTVGEEYKKQPEDLEIEWKWINEVWEMCKAGTEKVLFTRPRPNQYKSLDNPSKCRLPYTGISKPQLSLIRRVKDIQYLFDIIMYRMELAVAQAKGKKMIMDVAQIPKSEGFDMQKWLYYFDTAGIAFINSFEEGSGSMAGERPSFNQFTDVDLTISSAINQYIGILDRLDALIEDITGVTRQRQGNIHQSETVGGVERSVVQSSAVTEYLFYQHNRVKKRVLTNLLEEAKLAWLEGKKAQYIMDDIEATRRILNIDGEQFNNEEYGLMVTNSEKENRIMQFLEQNAMGAIQAGAAELHDVIGAMRTESIAKAQRILDEGKEKAKQQAMEEQQQQQQAAAQMQQQQLEAQRQMAIEDREDKQAHAIELENVKGEWDIKKEEVRSFMNQQDQDINNNQIPDQLEVEKLRAEERKDIRKNNIEEKKLRQKDRELDIKAREAKNKANQKKK